MFNLKRRNMSFLHILISLGILFPLGNNTNNQIHLKISNIPSGKGNILIAVYDKEDGFREKDQTFKNLTIPAQSGNIEATIPQVPEGTYAVAIFHDANGNGKLDKNILGIPTEAYGFSNNAKGSFGPPSYKQCSFALSGKKTLEIKLN